MRPVVLTSVVLLLTTAAFAQQTTDPSQSPTALGDAFFKAILNEDGSTMGKLLADDCSITSFDGQTVDGNLLVQGMDGGVVVFDTGVVSDARTRQYNGSAAVMTGTWKVKGTIQGQALDATAYFSVVSAKTGATWKIVNIQFTPVH